VLSAASSAVHGGSRHPLVQAAPGGQVRVGVEGVADQRVPEVEGDLVGAGEDEIGVLQLAQGAGHLIRAAAGDDGQQVEVEGAPDDGGRRGHIAGEPGQVPDAAQHRVAQRVRHRGGLDRRAGLRGQGVLVDGGEEFLDMQRDPVAALVDRLHHLGRSGPAEQRAGHGRGLGQPQPRQPDLLGQPLAQQPGSQVAHWQPGIQLIAAVGARDQQRPGREPAGQVAEHIQAQLVGPVQVFENDQDGGAGVGGYQQVGQVLYQHTAPVVRVAGGIGDRPYPRRQALP